MLDVDIGKQLPTELKALVPGTSPLLLSLDSRSITVNSDRSVEDGCWAATSGELERSVAPSTALLERLELFVETKLEDSFPVETKAIKMSLVPRISDT